MAAIRHLVLLGAVMFTLSGRFLRELVVERYLNKQPQSLRHGDNLFAPGSDAAVQELMNEFVEYFAIGVQRGDKEEMAALMQEFLGRLAPLLNHDLPAVMTHMHDELTAAFG